MRKALVFAVGLAVCVSGSSDTFAARAPSGMVMVVPARTRVIQFAFDLASLRQATLVSYQTLPGDGEVALHVWDPQLREWVRTSFDEYASGNLFESSRDVTTVVIAGSEQEVPGALASVAEKFGAVKIIPSVNIVPMVNGVNDAVRLTPTQWRWLAARYGLQLEDQNAERRRWGRYGPPEGRAVPPPVAVEKETSRSWVMPPAASKKSEKQPKATRPAAPAEQQSFTVEALPPAALPEPMDIPADLESGTPVAPEMSVQPQDK